MHYYCIENQKVVGVHNYEPSVPSSVKVYQISEEDYNRTIGSNATHYFDVVSCEILPIPSASLDKIQAEKEYHKLTTEVGLSDWKVLRHIREKALELPTTLTEEEYVALELQRQNTVEQIRSIKETLDPGLV
jgi:hypothetical protein